MGGKRVGHKGFECMGMGFSWVRKWAFIFWEERLLYRGMGGGGGG